MSETSFKINLRGSSCQITGQEKQNTDVKSISAQCTASSVPLFIFLHVRFCLRIIRATSLTELGEGLGEGEIEYSITVRKLILRFDSVWVSVSSQAGRPNCRLLYWQSKHVHRELKEEDLRPFNSGLCSTSIKGKGGNS